MYRTNPSLPPSTPLSLFPYPLSLLLEMHQLLKVTNSRILPFPSCPQSHFLIHITSSYVFLCRSIKFVFLILCSSPTPSKMSAKWWCLSLCRPTSSGRQVCHSSCSLHTAPSVFAVQRLSLNFLCLHQKKILSPK